MSDLEKKIIDARALVVEAHRNVRVADADYKRASEARDRAWFKMRERNGAWQALLSEQVAAEIADASTGEQP